MLKDVVPDKTSERVLVLLSVYKYINFKMYVLLKISLRGPIREDILASLLPWLFKG